MRIRVEGVVGFVVFRLFAVSAAQEPAPGEAGSEAWQGDLATFEAHLAGLAGEFRVPTMDEFKRRLDDGGWDDGRLMVVSDGAGGVVDFVPPDGTLQYGANLRLKGKRVRWEIELARAVEPSVQTSLKPELPSSDGEAGKGRAAPYLNELLFQAHFAELPPTPLNAGDRIVLEGTIGDTAPNQENHEQLFSGATVIHYLVGVPHPLFWLGLEDVKISRVSPTEAEVSGLLLSDGPSLDRGAWKTEAEQGVVVDGDPETAWRAGETGASVVIDLGAERRVGGVRVLPPSDRKVEVGAGRVAISVKASGGDWSGPVAEGRFLAVRDEQEFRFGVVEARFVKLEFERAVAGGEPVAIAEVNLVGGPVAFPARVTESDLPAMAAAIERFSLLHDRLSEPPAALALSEVQMGRWRRVHKDAGSRWYRRHSRALWDVLDDAQWDAIGDEVERADASPFERANLYAVFEASGEVRKEQRLWMDRMAEAMDATRRDFLAGIKRLLTAEQQVAFGALLSPPLRAPGIRGEWLELTAGEGLEGWEGDAGVWSAADGVIRGRHDETGDDRWLVYRGAAADGGEERAGFGDFRLSLEYRIVDGLGGVLLRGRELERGEGEAASWGGYLVDLGLRRETVGGILEEGGRGLLTEGGMMSEISVADGQVFTGKGQVGNAAEQAQALRPTGEWKRLEVTALGGRVSYVLNGVLISQVRDQHPEAIGKGEGAIAFVLRGGDAAEVELRNVRVQAGR